MATRLTGTLDRAGADQVGKTGIAWSTQIEQLLQETCGSARVGEGTMPPA